MPKPYHRALMDEAGTATTLDCARCSGGSGLICDACNVAVNLAAIRDACPESHPLPEEEPS
jgi:hypothetical protein